MDEAEREHTNRFPLKGDTWHLYTLSTSSCNSISLVVYILLNMSLWQMPLHHFLSHHTYFPEKCYFTLVPRLVFTRHNIIHWNYILFAGPKKKERSHSIMPLILKALRWMIPPMVVHPEKTDFRRFV